VVCIDDIVANCLLLRTLTLHLFSDLCFLPDVSGQERDFLSSTLDRNVSYSYGMEHTVNALKEFRVRDTIAIIAVETEGNYINLRRTTAIAPLKQWQTMKLGKWPGISITGKQVWATKSLIREMGAL